MWSDLTGLLDVHCEPKPLRLDTSFSFDKKRRKCVVVRCVF